MGVPPLVGFKAPLLHGSLSVLVLGYLQLLGRVGSMSLIGRPRTIIAGDVLVSGAGVFL